MLLYYNSQLHSQQNPFKLQKVIWKKSFNIQMENCVFKVKLIIQVGAFKGKASYSAIMRFQTS